MFRVSYALRQARRLRLLGRGALASSLAAAWAPIQAGATNSGKPVSLPTFVDPPCMAVVDRSTDAVFHLDYEVVLEDTGLTEDEVADSRRHQFFAFRRTAFSHPEWITRADVERAAAKDLVVSDAVSSDNVLEEAAEWPPESWTRLNADDDRLPITKARAMEGVDWDTTAIPAGMYVIAGYTWEPPQSRWSYRYGAVKVVDGPDPNESAPAIYVPLLVGDSKVFPGESYEVVGCVDAGDDAVMDVDWAFIQGLEVGQWHSFEEGVPVATGEFRYVFTPPQHEASRFIRLRLTVRDAQGRSTETLAPIPLRLEGEEPVGESESSSSGGSGSEDGETADSATDGSAPGGGCCAAKSSEAPAWALALIGLSLWRRRSSAPRRPSRRRAGAGIRVA